MILESGGRVISFLELRMELVNYFVKQNDSPAPDAIQNSFRREQLWNCVDFENLFQFLKICSMGTD